MSHGSKLHIIFLFIVQLSGLDDISIHHHVAICKIVIPLSIQFLM